MTEQCYSHGGACGDILAHLPFIKSKGGGHFYVYRRAHHWWRVCPERVESLFTLLRLQPYLLSCDHSDDVVGLDMDGWRQAYNCGMNITDMFFAWQKLPFVSRDDPWLRVDRPRRVAPVVFHRSPRYHNPRFPWKAVVEQYRDNAVFVSTDWREYADFVRAFGPVNYHHCETYLDLARVIAGADLFVGNQSSPSWVSEGLKTCKILESVQRWEGCWNCDWERAGHVSGYDESVRLPPLADLAEWKVTNVIRRAAGRTLLDNGRLANIARLAASVEHVPGDAAELGSYRGGSAAVISACLPAKQLYVFDTFAGIPEDDAVAGGHAKGDFAADLADVRSFLGLYPVSFHVGTFPDTTVTVPEKTKFSLVHLDADTYQSTKAGLEFFLPRLSPGGVVVLDDYGWHRCPGVKQAADEAGVTDVVVSGQHAWWRKP